MHDVPNGEIWTLEAIEDLRDYIESFGLRWSVVESLPVCEAVKYAGSERDRLIENYKISLANLGKAGIRTVCYNFMPVIDWIRTTKAVGALHDTNAPTTNRPKPTNLFIINLFMSMNNL